VSEFLLQIFSAQNLPSPLFCRTNNVKQNKSLVARNDKLSMSKEARCLKSTVKHHADTCSHITLNSAFLLVLLLLGTGNAFPFEQAMLLGLPFSPHIKGNYYISKPLPGP